MTVKKIEEKFKENSLREIKENRENYWGVSHYIEEGINIILGIEEVKIISVESHHIEEAFYYMKNYYLLPRDALHVAIMLSIECKNIASADSDFDRVPSIVK
ncbi:MAG: hypothetical protein B6U94_07450 [Thermofilum sp. ex4484_79]|nr:MAG: hypothetical protein B6U94_07450 [Thermofilum sp. ex4484_79]